MAVRLDIRGWGVPDPPRVLFTNSRLADGLSMQIVIDESARTVEAVVALLRSTADMVEIGRFLGPASD